jgi:hypothetical protein
VTASEFAFLALGLVLGAAAGAALVEVLRSRPPARREVRVTVAPNSIPRRAATLTETDPGDRGPARGGPADRRWVDRTMPAADEPPPGADEGVGVPVIGAAATAGTPRPASDDRTSVSSGPSGPSIAPFRLAAAGAAGAAIALSAPRSPLGISISRESDPMVAALRATAGATAAAAMRRARSRPSSKAVVTGSAVAVEVAVAAASAKRRVDDSGGAGGGGADGGAEGGGARGGGPATADPGDASSSAAPDVPDDACAEQRRIADERCAVAARAREGAAAAVEALRTSQRTYDDLVSRADAEASAADPRAVRQAKEAAQVTFRHARAAGRTRDDIEAAAREWLTEINRINQDTRESTAAAERHRRAAADIAPSLERLAVEADAARISAETAEEACVAAREAVADCQEAAALAARGVAASTEPRADDAPADDSDSVLTPMGSRAGEDAAIIRLLRGDREVMTRIVARLAGDDEDARRHWQGLMAEFVGAVVARAIEASALDFPEDGPFWGMFTQSQNRDIAGALSSLGYRHDGFGGWADDRVPSQRDLSLAVGYAGLDPMRIRRWPSETEMPDLLRNVTVAADEYVWEAAGGLTLGELVSLLGRRADGLAELWNEWGTVRPLLLSAD